MSKPNSLMRRFKYGIKQWRWAKKSTRKRSLISPMVRMQVCSPHRIKSQRLHRGKRLRVGSLSMVLRKTWTNRTANDVRLTELKPMKRGKALSSRKSWMMKSTKRRTRRGGYRLSVYKQKRHLLNPQRTWIPRWRLYLRRKKRDAQVRVVLRNGEKMRRILKLGGRRIYRRLKRKFPRWWKLSRVNKQMKKRRADKQIFGFRWWNRSRNHMEVRMLRRRKFYARRKRIEDFLAWKLFMPKGMLGRFRLRQRVAMTGLMSRNGLDSSLTPGLNGRHAHRLTMAPELRRYSSHTRIGASVLHSPHFVQVLRYPVLKRYRHRSWNRASRLDSSVSVSKVQQSLLEGRLENWRHHAWFSKNRAYVLRNERFSKTLKRGRRVN